jgi:hypothetical protein
VKKAVFLAFFPIFVGERLLYNVYFLKFKVGKIESVVVGEKVLDGNTLYHIKCNIKSSPPFSAIYKVDDEINAFIQKDTLLPIVVEKDVRRRRRKNHMHARLNHEQLFAKINTDGREKVVPIIKPTLDIISLFYYLRKEFENLPPTLGILKEGGIHSIMIRRVGEEKIRVGGRIYDTVLLQQYPEGVRAWLHREERIPIKIKIPTKWGTCHLLLRRWKR